MLFVIDVLLLLLLLLPLSLTYYCWWWIFFFISIRFCFPSFSFYKTNPKIEMTLSVLKSSMWKVNLDRWGIICCVLAAVSRHHLSHSIKRAFAILSLRCNQPTLRLSGQASATALARAPLQRMRVRVQMIKKVSERTPQEQHRVSLEVWVMCNLIWSHSLYTHTQARAHTLTIH